MQNKERTLIIEALKKTLKEQKISYEKLAEKSAVPLSTIKKVFAGQDLPLGRLVTLCESIGLDFFDLCELAKKSKQVNVFEFTEKQYQLFKKDRLYFLVFDFIYRQAATWTQTIQRFGLQDAQLYKVISELERVGLLQLMEENEFRFLVSGGMKIKKGSILRDLIFDPAAYNLLSYSQDKSIKKEKHFYSFTSAWVTEETRKKKEKILREASKSLNELAMMDRKFAAKEQLKPVSWLIIHEDFDSMLSLVLK